MVAYISGNLRTGFTVGAPARVVLAQIVSMSKVLCSGGDLSDVRVTPANSVSDAYVRVCAPSRVASWSSERRVTAEWLGFRTVQRWGIDYIRGFRTGLRVGAPTIDAAHEIIFKVRCYGCSDSLADDEQDRTSRHVAQVCCRVAPHF